MPTRITEGDAAGCLDSTFRVGLCEHLKEVDSHCGSQQFCLSFLAGPMLFCVFGFLFCFLKWSGLISVSRAVLRGTVEVTWIQILAFNGWSHREITHYLFWIAELMDIIMFW